MRKKMRKRRSAVTRLMPQEAEKIAEFPKKFGTPTGPANDPGIKPCTVQNPDAKWVTQDTELLAAGTGTR